MKLNIKLLKQNTQFGCLATCFFMIKNYFFEEEEFNQDKESSLTNEAFCFETGFNEHYYLNKLSKLSCDIRVFVETPYLAESYNKLNTKYNCNILIEYSILGIRDFESLLEDGYAIITLIDMWYLDMIVHDVHYVIVNGFDDNSIYLLDPKYGYKLKFSKERFLNSFETLKEKFGYSPLIFAIKK